MWGLGFNSQCCPKKFKKKKDWDSLISHNDSKVVLFLKTKQSNPSFQRKSHRIMYYSNKYFPHKSQICTSKYSEVLVLVVIINKVNIKHSYSLNLSFHHKTGICLFLKNLSKQDFFSLVLGIKFVTLYLPGRHLCRCAKSLTQNKIFSVGIVQW